MPAFTVKFVDPYKESWKSPIMIDSGHEGNSGSRRSCLPQSEKIGNVYEIFVLQASYSEFSLYDLSFDISEDRLETDRL